MMPVYSKGFSLLEALVALVIFTTVGLSLYGLINTSVISLQRAQSSSVRQQAVDNALSYLETVNPMQQPSGWVDFGIARIEWSAELIKPIVDNVANPTGKGLYQVGLYRNTVSIYRSKDLLDSFDIEQLGYRQVRIFKPPL